MSDKQENRIFITGMILFVMLLATILVVTTIDSKNAINDRCKTYCECQSEECPYVFDYDDVKGCECK